MTLHATGRTQSSVRYNLLTLDPTLFPSKYCSSFYLCQWLIPECSLPSSYALPSLCLACTLKISIYCHLIHHSVFRALHLASQHVPQYCLTLTDPPNMLCLCAELVTQESCQCVRSPFTTNLTCSFLETMNISLCLPCQLKVQLHPSYKCNYSNRLNWSIQFILIRLVGPVRSNLTYL